MWSSKLAADTRGTSTVEYAILLFAILLVGASAVRKLGPRVMMGASVTTRILNGEDITLSGSGTAPPGGDSRASTGASLSSGIASEPGAAALAHKAGQSRALMASGAAFGSGVVLGATGASSFGGSQTDALLSTGGGESTSTAAKSSASTSSKAKPAASSVASNVKASTTTTAFSNGSYSISAKGEAQMTALLNEAKSQADGKPPLGHCYASVADYIDAVGYGSMGKAPGSSLPSVPDAYGTYAHQFADYMNAKGANGQTNASRLGLQKLPITNPYDAPPGSIIVVRAGTPGTANPVAGDIVVVGKNGRFYNDGNMGYGGSQNFPKGNTYVLGVYAPK